MEMRNLTIAGIKDGLSKKEFSASELVESFLDAIRARDKELHSYLFINDDEAKNRAAMIDAKIASGGAMGELAGIPIAVKDNILVKNLPATAASRILEPYISAFDATVVKRMNEAGSIILGKTNLDEFAMGSSTENSAFGPTKNPRDLMRVPGGSSGGSAAAVADHLAVAALGSDTGGSIRQPAALSGVVGFKPTYGRVSRHGLIAMASSLDQIGPLTRTVEDAAIVYKVIAGCDRYDATSSSKPAEAMTSMPLSGLKIGMPREYFAEGLDPRIGDCVKSAIKLFESKGAKVEEVTLPHAGYALAAYYIVMPAEVSANLARFDGLRYGYSAPSAKTLLDLYKDGRDLGFGSEPKRRIMTGTYVLSHGYYGAYYLQAQKMRTLIRKDFEDAFSKVDVIMGPTTPSVAFKAGSKTENPLAMYLEDIYTVAINLSGLPGISIPCGTVEEGGKILPVGLQIIGSWFDEAKLLGVARSSEEALYDKTAPLRI